jgi:PAS domain S-box-containing protein
LSQDLSKLTKAQLIAEVDRLRAELAALPDVGVSPVAIIEALETTLRNAPIATAVIAPDGLVSFVGGRRAAQFGLKSNDPVGRHVGTVLLDRADLLDGINQAIGGTSVNLVDQVEEKFFDVWLAPLDPDHPPSHVACLAFDVTERALTEAALRTERHMFEVLVDSAAAPIMIRDMEGRYQYVNKELERRTGLEFDKIKGKTPQEVLSPHLAELFVKQTTEVIEHGAPLTWTLEVPGVDGEEIVVMRTQYPIRGEDGAIMATGVIDVDVTDLRLAEESMRRAIREAEEASRAKSRFLAAASHDLRQPLHAMGLFVSILQRSTGDARQALLVDRLASSVTSLNRLLDALLDISKLEAGVVTPKPARFSIQTLLGNLVDEFEPSAREKGLHLRLVPCRAIVETDPALLETILRNLLSNAIRYTKTGRILLGCRRLTQAIRIEIWDTGAGMDGPEIEQAFAEFERLSRHREFHQSDSMGLGLAIVRRTARLLNLSLDTCSVPNRGSRFGITLPAVFQAAPAGTSGPPRPGQARSLSDRVIVVIDDDNAVLDATVRMLESWRCRAIAAATAEDALALCDLGSVVPDAVIADYRLAGGARGTDAIASLQRKYGRTLPGIVVTGETHPVAQASAEAAGYLHLIKPVEPADLLRELSNLIGPGTK